ncbi:DUF3800 domain-containing protein [Pedobacter aquatilis]|uniref:DUF3800 domain-containing protein n=1 Tax=Pedobacter aquatilis TaxID=351343 RepID=UPI0025B56807|nr:DUF3800 domain-containing protein [Pedobacter aquatilis]MDN3585660.1 DUF3800 domain-containing protein [Pedobacter aquatilis]
MGNIYVDDSVHDQGDFIICACVYASMDIEAEILRLIQVLNLDAETFEFKSSANYSKEPERAEFRSRLKELMQDHGHYGLVILPRANRVEAGLECLRAIQQFIEFSPIIRQPVSIYLDQGLFSSKDQAEKHFKALGLSGATLHAEQDSKTVRGIQLADLVAHMASIQLKSAMGLIKKMVKAGENSGYEPDMKLELEFEMWATLRYCLMNEGNPKPQTGDQFRDANMQVGRAGLFIAESCGEELREYAEGTFGQVYLGCIH